jgi:hypothetical protein
MDEDTRSGAAVEGPKPFTVMQGQYLAFIYYVERSRPHLSLNRDAAMPRSVAVPGDGRVVVIKLRRPSSPLRTLRRLPRRHVWDGPTRLADHRRPSHSVH